MYTTSSRRWYRSVTLQAAWAISSMENCLDASPIPPCRGPRYGRTWIISHAIPRRFTKPWWMACWYLSSCGSSRAAREDPQDDLPSPGGWPAGIYHPVDLRAPRAAAAGGRRHVRAAVWHGTILYRILPHAR